MAQVESREPLSPQVASRLTEFARACKAATRAVSLYPEGHPAIGASLARLVEAAARAIEGGPLALSVLPGGLQVDQRAPARPDAAVAELAALLHEHLIGELRLVSAADAAAWRTFLLLLAQAPGDVQSQGGIARLWTAAGGQHLQVREVDYAEVLREREAGIEARWDTIIEHCLQGDAIDLDEETVRILLEIAADPARLADLAAQIDERAAASGGVRIQTEALLRLMHRIADGVLTHHPEKLEAVLSNIAMAAGRLSPDVMLEVLTHRHEARPDHSIDVVDAMVTRMTDATVSQFVARSIVEERGATERLAEAFQALVPEMDRRQRLLGLARDEVGASPLGTDASFPDLWQRATDMLTSYRDEPFVSDSYARELSTARAHSSNVERIGDDPPEQISEWVSSVSDASLRARDMELLLDLLRIEEDPARYRDVLDPAVAHVDDLVLLGDFEGAVPLVASLCREAGPEGRPTHAQAAGAAVDRLLQGPLMAHLVAHLRTVDDEGFVHARALCHALGTMTIKPLAEALSVEDRGRGFRRLTDLLVGFGKAGREAAEQLKASANPAVRRTAIYLLREFGGNDALPELTPLLDDADANVQREAVRAIAVIGTNEAFAVLQHGLASGSPRQREAIIAALGSIRDERAVPLFGHMVRNRGYRKTQRTAWLAAVDGLAAAATAEAVEALREALFGGEWWAPLRTAALRRAVAAALRRAATPQATAVLQQAADVGPRSARNAAREQLALGPARARTP
jgi:hypothetical protein